MNAVTRSTELGAQVLQAICGYVHAGGRNEFVALAAYDAVREHHEATILLVKQQLHGSAMTLLRTMFEGCIVGLWAVYLASDEELDSFAMGRLTLEPSKVLRRLRSKDEGDFVQILESFYEENKDFLNSYVHVGHEAVAGRLSASYIGPNYPPEKIKLLLEFADAMLIVVVMEISSLVKEQALRERLNAIVTSHVARQP